MEQQNIKHKTPLVFKTAIALLCALVISFNLVGGLYARYTTTVTSTATARVAKIDFGMAGTSSQYVFDSSFKFDASIGVIYAVIEEFTVTNTGEVSYEYELSLRLSGASSYSDATPDAYITLASPRKLSYLYQISETAGNVTAENKSAAAMTNEAMSMLNSGSGYCAYSGDSNEGTRVYNWEEATVKNDGTMTVSKKNLAIGETHYYKIVYFIQIKPETSFKKMNLFCSAVCEQIN